MLGDREKCIQAQMDEYLSKPLKQNQLIQTILKCATLGGALLERNDQRRGMIGDSQADSEPQVKVIEPSSPTTPPSGRPTPKRPKMVGRGATDVGQTDDSPSIITADQSDPFERVSISFDGGGPRVRANVDTGIIQVTQRLMRW